MKHRSLQWVPVQTRLYRFCLAIVLASMFLGAGGLLPLSAAAQDGSIDTILSGKQNVLAGNVASATVQIPPGVVNRLRQALSKRTKIPTAKLKVIEAVPKIWTNGCLGLAQADEVCTQALVEGWRVVFSDGSQCWIYRTDQQGRIYRLEA